MIMMIARIITEVMIIIIMVIMIIIIMKYKNFEFVKNKTFVDRLSDRSNSMHNEDENRFDDYD